MWITSQMHSIRAHSCSAKHKLVRHHWPLKTVKQRPTPITILQTTVACLQLHNQQLPVQVGQLLQLPLQLLLQLGQLLLPCCCSCVHDPHLHRCRRQAVLRVPEWGWGGVQRWCCRAGLALVSHTLLSHTRMSHTLMSQPFSSSGRNLVSG